MFDEKMRELLGTVVSALRLPGHAANDFNCQDWPPDSGCRGCAAAKIRAITADRVEAALADDQTARELEKRR